MPPQTTGFQRRLWCGNCASSDACQAAGPAGRRPPLRLALTAVVSGELSTSPLSGSSLRLGGVRVSSGSTVRPAASLRKLLAPARPAGPASAPGTCPGRPSTASSSPQFARRAVSGDLCSLRQTHPRLPLHPFDRPAVFRLRCSTHAAGAAGRLGAPEAQCAATISSSSLGRSAAVRRRPPPSAAVHLLCRADLPRPFIKRNLPTRISPDSPH